MTTLEIRPNLHIHIQTAPGSANIKWWLPDSPPVMFNPQDSSLRPYGKKPPLGKILSSIAPDDLDRIKRRLLQVAEERRSSIAKAKALTKVALNPAYHQTVFEYIPTGKPTDFWVITAYNPDGKTADAGDNISADSNLREEIVSLGLVPFRVIGRSPDSSHAEPGWGFPCDETSALEIGRRYRQEAVFHFTAGRIELVDCESGSHESLGNPSSRILDPRDVRHFTLFVGAPSGRNRLDPLEYAGVCTRIGALFPGFTIQRAEGCFRSSFEETLLIHIGTREPLKVIETAHNLRCFLNQEGIGISHNGVYQRVREWSDNALILESFGFTATKPDPS